MKIRNGFVSNSSSTSFIIQTYISANDFKEYMSELFKALSNFGYNMGNINEHMEILSLNENKENLIQELKEWNYTSKILHSKSPAILINSVHDNSIPFIIQQIFEEMSSYRLDSVQKVERFHWS